LLQEHSHSRLLLHELIADTIYENRCFLYCIHLDKVNNKNRRNEGPASTTAVIQSSLSQRIWLLLDHAFQSCYIEQTPRIYGHWPVRRALWGGCETTG
jgi:hypothetical protein